MVGQVFRGEVYWGDLDPVIGHEQAGTRPLLIVQNDVGNEVSPTLIVAAVTSRPPRRVFPFIVEVPAGLLPKRSWVNCAQVRTVDRMRLKGTVLARLDDATMSEVDAALRESLGLH